MIDECEKWGLKYPVELREKLKELGYDTQ